MTNRPEPRAPSGGDEFGKETATHLMRPGVAYTAAVNATDAVATTPPMQRPYAWRRATGD